MDDFPHDDVRLWAISKAPALLRCPFCACLVDSYRAAEAHKGVCAGRRVSQAAEQANG